MSAYPFAPQPTARVEQLRVALARLPDAQRLALALEAVRDTRDPFCRQQLGRIEELARHTRADLEADHLRRAVG